VFVGRIGAVCVPPGSIRQINHWSLIFEPTSHLIKSSQRPPL
jgi:hypothetical protein